MCKATVTQGKEGINNAAAERNNRVLRASLVLNSQMLLLMTMRQTALIFRGGLHENNQASVGLSGPADISDRSE
jgi:hypothetical protein